MSVRISSSYDYLGYISQYNNLNIFISQKFSSPLTQAFNWAVGLSSLASHKINFLISNVFDGHKDWTKFSHFTEKRAVSSFQKVNTLIPLETPNYRIKARK